MNINIIILLWIAIAHLIYVLRIAISKKDNELNYLYASCLIWPFSIGDLIAICITFILDGFKWLDEYIDDMYWDIMMFYSYMESTTTTD